ncbi:MAG: vWA domain-containing protein [Planctomycetota bacterium]
MADQLPMIVPGIAPLAFGFLNLPMLGWLAAAAAPLLIHLLSRRRYRETSWAAMEYLLAAIRRRSRRLRLQHWVLLLLRTLLIVLLVLAVAEPALRPESTLAAPAADTLRVLVLDISYSMAYRPGGESRLQRAQAIAREMVETSPAGDGFALVIMAELPQLVVATPSIDKPSILAALDALEPSHGGFSLLGALGAVGQVLSENTLRRWPRSEVVVLSDFCRPGWSTLSAVERKEVQRLAAQWRDTAALVLIDVGQSGAENVAVTGLRALNTPLAGRATQLEATLRRFGRQAAEQPVTLKIDSRQIDSQATRLSADGEATVRFSLRLEAAGELAGEAVAPGDALELDNHRYVALPVAERARVLCVAGRQSAGSSVGVAHYLTLALAPQGKESPVVVEVVNENALTERDLTRYDCIFLCNIAQFTKGEARALAQAAAHGGSLVFFLGQEVLPQRYNQQLQGPDGQSLLPARLGDAVSQAQGRLDPRGYEHPLAASFRGRGEAALLTTPVFKYIKLELPDPPGESRVALAIAGGDPLVAEHPFGRGRVLLVATSADTSWTAMPLWPSFLPLVQEMLQFCLTDRVRQRNVVVGEALAGSLTPAGAAPPTILMPDGQSRAAEPAGEAHWMFADTRLAGIYVAQSDGAEVKYAVNLRTAESDLARVSIDELRTELFAGVPVAYETTGRSHPQEIVARAEGRSTSISAALLLLVLAVALTESTVAWYFGRSHA